MSMSAMPQPPGWIARSEWNLTGWRSGWLAFHVRCLAMAGGDVERARLLWQRHCEAARDAIEHSQTPAAEGDSHFGTGSCWRNSARRAVAALELRDVTRPLEERRQRAREAFYDTPGWGSDVLSALEAAIETATRVRITDEVMQALVRTPGRLESGLAAAFRAAGFIVED